MPPKISLDLAGKWEFKQYPLSARRMRDLDSADWQITSVPSSIFDSLIAAGQIERSVLNAYPEKFSWVSEKQWIYRKIFDAPNCPAVEFGDQSALKVLKKPDSPTCTYEQ